MSTKAITLSPTRAKSAMEIKAHAGVGVTVGVAEGVGVFDAVGVVDGVKVIVGDGVIVTVGVSLAVGVCEGVNVGAGVNGPAPTKRTVRKLSTTPSRLEVRWSWGQAELKIGTMRGWLKSTVT